MRKTVVTLAFLFAGSIAAAAPVYSTNTFAVTEVAVSAMTNTVIAIPWKGYTSDGKPTLDIRADRLVSPRNLTAGDIVLLATNDSKYAAWILQAVTGGDTGAMEWAPVTTAQRSDFGGTTLIDHDGDDPAARGFGLWLIRQNPAKDGAPVPFYLYGQWTSGDQTVTIPGGSAEAPMCTLLADPDVTRSVSLNDLDWPTDSVSTNDTIVIPIDSKATRYCMRSKDNYWYYAQKVKKGVVMKTEYVKDITVPAGTGFWYVRREPTSFDITFKDPAAEDL